MESISEGAYVVVMSAVVKWGNEDRGKGVKCHFRHTITCNERLS